MKNNFEILIDLKNHSIDINSELVDNRYGVKLEDESLLFFISGSIFNEKDLINETRATNLFHAIQLLYRFKGKEFTKELTGEYCGFLFDKQADKIFVFTNITGSFPVFYYKTNHKLFVHSGMVSLVQKLKKDNYPYTLDTTAAYTLLTLIGLMDNQTLISEISKLRNAEQINIELREKKLAFERIGDVDNLATYKGNKKEALAQMDFLFKKAIRLEYDADIRATDKQFVLLSGGLDSRMNLMYAHKLGYKIDKALCYTHSNYWDEKIAYNIANDLKIPLQIVHLDGGDFLKIINPLLEDTYYTADYRIGAQSRFALKEAYKDDHGFVHSGIMGDGVLGSYLGAAGHEPPIKAFSKIINNKLFMPKIADYYAQLLQNYPNREMFLLKERGFNNLVGGAYVTQQFSLQASPFTNRDFMNFVLSLPQEWRYKQKIYIEWIHQYCPESTKYIWERTLLRPNAPWKTSFGDQVTFRIFSHFYRKVMRQPHKVVMAPYDYYFKTNLSLRQYFDEYFRNTIDVISDHPELKQDLYKMYAEGKFRDKTRVLSLLGSYRKLFK